jgi:hypothetical protein
MPTTIANMVVDLEANSAKLVSGLRKGEAAVKSSSARMNRSLALVDRSFKRLGGAVAGATKRFLSMNLGIATLLGGAGLGLLIKRSLDAADAIAKTADAVGFGVESLQEYRAAASLAGVQQKLFDQSLIAFVKRVGEARAGVGPLVSGLKSLDGELLKTIKNSKNQEEAFDAVIAAMARATTATDKARIANAAFSRSGVVMVNLAREGPEAFAEMRAEARRLGFVIEESLVRSAEKANDQLTIMGQVMRTQVTRAVLTLAPSIIRLGAAFAEAAPKLRSFIEALFPSLKRRGL